MKETIHIIRQIFMSTRAIENHVKYQILCIGCGITHFVFMILMLVGGVTPFFIVNLLATFFYAFLGSVLAVREKYKLLFIAAFFEVEVNASITSIMFGQGYDFMLYTLCLIPGAFYLAHTWPAKSGENKYRISMIPSISTIIVAILYVLVDVLQSVISPVFVGEELVRLRLAFHYFNIMISVLLLLAFSVFFALEVRYIQGMLNDENSRLDEIASKDPLTKALNRRSFNQIITQEIENDAHMKFGLIILDIDDFKHVNDTYGHVIGDQVLIQIASHMRNNLRENDYFCRWGGEEFLIMIHGAADDYATVAERIRTDIEKQVYHAGDTDFSVTATLGIAEYQTGIQMRTLVDMADQKMYFGKKNGKNQVVS